MPLLIVSGLPSPQKKALFHSLLSGLIKKYKGLEKKEDADAICPGPIRSNSKIEHKIEQKDSSVDSFLVILQNTVSVDAKEETAKMRSIIQNKLNKKVLVLIYAPLHIKGLRYEIASAAKNMEIDTAHIYCAAEYKEGGSIEEEEIESLYGKECSVLKVHGNKEKTEDFKTVSRIFEKPRKSDKWDSPCLVVEENTADACHAIGIEKAWEVMQKPVKARVSSKKLISGPLDTKYLQKVKEIISEVVEEKKKTASIPLMATRQAEIDFINSIHISSPPIKKIKEIYTSFLEKYLN